MLRQVHEQAAANCGIQRSIVKVIAHVRQIAACKQRLRFFVCALDDLNAHTNGLFQIIVHEAFRTLPVVRLSIILDGDDFVLFGESGVRKRHGDQGQAQEQRQQFAHGKTSQFGIFLPQCCGKILILSQRRS